MPEALPARLRVALLAVSALTALGMAVPGGQALALGMLSNLTAGLAFSRRDLLGEWKAVASWALAWSVALLALGLLAFWPIDRLMQQPGLHMSVVLSAVVGLVVLLTWRFVDAWRMPGGFANDAFRMAMAEEGAASWRWRGLAMAVGVVCALALVIAFAWPGLWQGSARWIAAGVAALLIPAVHFFKRPSGLAKPEERAADRAYAKNAERLPIEGWPDYMPADAVALDDLAGRVTEIPGPAYAAAHKDDEASASLSAGPERVERAESVAAPVDLDEHPVPGEGPAAAAEPASMPEPAPAPAPVRSAAEQQVMDAALYGAARGGRVERALALLAEGARADALPAVGERDQRSLVVLAAVLPDLRLLRALIERGVELNPADPARAPLAIATRDSWHGRPEAVATLLANGADARRVDAQGNTALHHAAHSTDAAVAALLLDAGADLNAINGEGITPVLVAATSGNWRVAKFLIERGAKLNLDGAMPALNAAARCDDDDAAGVELFLRHKARLDAVDDEGRGPLHIAAQRGHIGILQALLDHGLPLDARDGNGRGVLHHAVAGEASTDFVRELLHMGARADIEDLEGLTPAQLARRQSHWGLVSVLEPGFLPEVPSENDPVERAPYAAVTEVVAAGDVPGALQHAARLNTAERVRLMEEQGLATPALARWLLRNGVDAHAVNREGRALVSLALLASPDQTQAHEVAQAFLDAGAQPNGRGIFAAHLLQVMADANRRVDGEPLARQLVERGADLFGLSPSGDTPLHLAVRLGWHGLAHDLIERGVNPDAPDAQGMTPLHWAIQRRDRALVKSLVAAGASPRLRANDGQTALGLALASGRKDLVEWVDWRQWPSPGRRLRAQDLPAAAIAGDTHAVRRLLELGFDVNARDGQGCTALLRAAGGGHVDVLDELLAQGADPSVAADAGATPLSAAVSMRNLGVVEKLLNAGADVEQRLPGDVTLLMLASALGLPRMAALLKRHKADVAAVDAQGFTALHCACLFAFGAKDRTAAVTLLDNLLLAGADPDPKGTPAVAPLLLLLGARAEPGAQPDEAILLAVLEPLLAEGVSLDVRDARGFGPLHVAALHGLMQVIRALLRAGANPEQRDALNRTAREVALMRGYVDIATELGGQSTRAPQGPQSAGPVSLTQFLRPPGENPPRD